MLPRSIEPLIATLDHRDHSFVTTIAADRVEVVGAVFRKPDRHGTATFPRRRHHVAQLSHASRAQDAPLFTVLLPELASSLPLVGQRAGRCLMGSSFGGVASLAAAYRSPDTYGSLVLLSASLVFTDIGPDHAGTYDDRLVRQGVGWLFAHRRIRLDWRSPESIFPPLPK